MIAFGAVYTIRTKVHLRGLSRRLLQRKICGVPQITRRIGPTLSELSVYVPQHLGHYRFLLFLFGHVTSLSLNNPLDVS